MGEVKVNWKVRSVPEYLINAVGLIDRSEQFHPLTARIGVLSFPQHAKGDPSAGVATTTPSRDQRM